MCVCEGIVVVRVCGGFDGVMVVAWLWYCSCNGIVVVREWLSCSCEVTVVTIIY